jgi:hypothetical protein
MGGGISQSPINARNTTMQLKAMRNLTISAIAMLFALTQLYLVSAVTVGNSTHTLVVKQLRAD